MFTDLNNDFQWFSDQKELLSEICELLGIKYTTPERFLEQRWLSVYDVSLSTEILMDAYIVCYHSFLSKEDKTVYTEILVEINKRSQIRTELAKKSMIELGKKRGLFRNCYTQTVQQSYV